jgi:cobalt-precorrin-5B (C1)-methyltransferase
MNNTERYVYKDNKKLRRGYTTGSCATAASKAAAIMLMSGRDVDNISIMTPKGIEINVQIVDIKRGYNFVSCAVQKDSGDDPDATDKILIYSKVTIYRSLNDEIKIDGGIGVGRVTKPGLECSVGTAAINKTPRNMIENEMKKVSMEWDYHGGIQVEIYVPQGVEVAKKTYNPKLGIVGGISILGTSGIVEPMSEVALLESLKVEMRVIYETKAKYIIITPGNYGETFMKDKTKLDLDNSVKCSNFIGDVLDYAVELGFKGVLLIGHIGKFIKLAGGIMNTHSKNADCRMEILMAHAAIQGCSIEGLKNIMNSITTDEAINYLDIEGLREKTIYTIMHKIDYYIKQRTYNNLEIGAIMFSNKYGILGQTKDAYELMNKLNKMEAD